MDKPWFKHYDKDAPRTIDYPAIPLDQLLTEASTKHPEHTAIIFGAAVGSRVMDGSLTYRQLDDLVNRFAAGLQQMGVGKFNTSCIDQGVPVCSRPALLSCSA